MMFRAPGFLSLLFFLAACPSPVNDDDVGTTDVLPGTAAMDSTVSSSFSSSFSSGLDSSSSPGCAFDVSFELSPLLSTVGIVTWSTELAAIDQAYIDFGPDSSYGMRAAVELDEPDFRTLLLGMRTDAEYHFRITAVSGASSCTSDDFVFHTGPAPTGLIRARTEVLLPSEVAPGFLIAPTYGGGGAGPAVSTGDVAIYDVSGEVVWWSLDVMSGISRAALSYDGKWMIARDANPNGGDDSDVMRISMDGLQREPLGVPHGHHDFAVTPDNGIVFIVRPDGEGCDEILELAEDGTWTTLFDVASGFDDLDESGEPCHSNSIQYDAASDSFTLSVLNQNAYLNFSADGELLWRLGGDDSQFTGTGATWSRQHGHHLLDSTRLLFFNNGSIGNAPGAAESSLAIEVELDFEAMTATRVWTYDGDNRSVTFGDVRRLGNGNTLVTYSNAGLVHEVNPEGVLVRTMSWNLGGAIGYTSHRATLYRE